jgi:hypothetical protein
MTKYNQGNLLWIGAPPVPPEPKPYLLGWNPALSRFKPHGLPIKKLATCSRAPAEFVSQTKSMLDAVPPGIKAALAKYGFAVLPVRDIYDAVLWLSYSGPRGHGDRFTWKPISGLCMFDGHLLLITQCHEDERGYHLADNRQGVFNHELGHCFDAALGYFSKSPEFMACYAEDVAKLCVFNQVIYRYLLQPGEAGPSETVAECFAVTQGPSCLLSSAKDMPEYFPSSFLFVKNQVDRLIAAPPQETTNAA